MAAWITRLSPVNLAFVVECSRFANLAHERDISREDIPKGIEAMAMGRHGGNACVYACVRACVCTTACRRQRTWSSRGRLSQSPIDHGIQPVHDLKVQKTLDCKAARCVNHDKRDETGRLYRRGCVFLSFFISFFFFNHFDCDNR